MKGLINVLMVLMIFLAGCATNTTQSTTLYEQLGGQSGIQQLTETFIRGIARDDRVFHYFADSNVTHFRDGFIEHLCAVSNGPCAYEGDSMIDIHTGMHINEADFNRIVELLIEAMEQEKVPYPVQNQLLARLAPLRSEIIDR